MVCVLQGYWECMCCMVIVRCRSSCVPVRLLILFVCYVVLGRLWTPEETPITKHLSSLCERLICVAFYFNRIFLLQIISQEESSFSSTSGQRTTKTRSSSPTSYDASYLYDAELTPSGVRLMLSSWIFLSIFFERQDVLGALFGSLEDMNERMDYSIDTIYSDWFIARKKNR